MTAAATSIALPQDTDTDPRRETTPFANLLLTSRRSQEAVASKLSNEDYIALRYDDDRLVAVVCDGVGQSFFGEIAARFLGEKLLDWLWDLPQDAIDEADRHAERLFNRLHDWTDDATQAVRAHPLPKDDANAIRRVVLERKRDDGSACVFACVRVDAAQQGTSCLGFWLGNTRLRLWDAKGTELDLVPHHSSNEQWSTAKGPVNSDLVHHIALHALADENVKRLTLHTDGIHHLDGELGQLTLVRLRDILRALADDEASDDISIVDITLK